jgi:hypothetical protein
MGLKGVWHEIFAFRISVPQAHEYFLFKFFRKAANEFISPVSTDTGDKLFTGVNDTGDQPLSKIFSDRRRH